MSRETTCCGFDKAVARDSYKLITICGDRLDVLQLNSVSEPVGTLDVALGHAARLLERDAALAAEQASEILKAVPGHPHARLILGAAHRIGGRPPPGPRELDPPASAPPPST